MIGSQIYGVQRRILPLRVWCTKAIIAFKSMVYQDEYCLWENGVPRRILPLSVWCTKANIAFKCVVYQQGEYCL